MNGYMAEKKAPITRLIDKGLIPETFERMS